MKKRIILIVFSVLIILLGYVSIKDKGYIIKESSSENWNFTGGKFLYKGGEEEIKYSIEYIGNNEFKPIDLVFEFLICPKNNNSMNDIKYAEHLHSYINKYMNQKVNDKFSKEGSWKGNFIDSNKDYYYENLYLKISYSISGTYFEEILELPMERM